MSKYRILLIVLLSVVTQLVMAQNKVITGTVEDSMGPVMMANVTERDANNRIVNATKTDMTGNFSMQVKNPKNNLVVSYVGCKTMTLKIGDKSTFNIKLEDEKTTLNEITVRGSHSNAGGLSIPKKENPLAQQTFSLQDVEGMAFTSADEALQGEIAGLDIVSNSGNLGSGTTMRLRGVSTISGNAQPLIVVDDKIFEYNREDIDIENADNEAFSSLLSVSVDDIAEITVLKDAAATAIWGSQGANGVIQIKTKRGSRGKPNVNLSYKFTGTWMPAGYELLNGDNYTMMLKEEFYNPTQKASATANIAEINYDPTWSEYKYWNRNTDWVNEVKQFGEQHEANMNVSGGGEKATFRISAGYNHQTGTIIRQELNRLTARLVLDYNVSDRIRFSTNFALTYTDNLKNYTLGSSKNDKKTNNNILAMALNMAPNMAITRDNGEYYLMNNYAAGKTPYDGNYSSEEMASVYSIGNPVAYANSSWQREKTYSIVPDFNLRYELLGTGNNESRLTFNGRVYFDIYSYTLPTYMPASLSNYSYTDTYYNYSTNTENNQFKLGARAEFIYTPHFNNEDLSLTMLARYETLTGKYSLQYDAQGQLPNGITSPTVDANMKDMNNSPTTTRSASHDWIYNAHFSYKERYNMNFSLRADGSSSFGPDNPWFYSPSVSLRYNLSDEPFFKSFKDVVSMFGLRGSWGITGRSIASAASFYNTYTKSDGYYGTGAYITMSGLKLTDLKPERKNGLNLGLNLGFFDDLIEVDLNMYKETTSDLIMKNVPTPSTTGFPSLSFGNVGKMENKGWEIQVTANSLVKVGKFSVSGGFNISQNANKLLEMNKDVLASMNTKFEDVYMNRGAGSLMKQVVVGDPLCSIYGYKSLGVYQYSYEYLQNYNTKMKQQDGAWSSADYENQINQWLGEGKTFPVATDANGDVIMTNSGEPQHAVYNYKDGDYTYLFKGGDAIYEDVNHDGQINELDIQYLGNSLPKLQGGFHLDLKYGRWKLVARFTFRYGNKILNTARMGLESMYGTENQCASVAYRWRKDGDVTLIPRALYNSGYNYQVSSRFVEDGSFLRFQNLQISYSVPRKIVKKWGFKSLSAYVTINNLFCFTKYSGIDPEVSASTYAPAIDSANTPRSKSVTGSLSFGF